MPLLSAGFALKVLVAPKAANLHLNPKSVLKAGFNKVFCVLFCMEDYGLGYVETSVDSDGITRANTGGLHSWAFPRSQRAIEAINKELLKMDFPSVYLLFQGEKDVYVGEAKSVYNRLITHNATPEEKIKDWNRGIIINDGRPATTSNFNDTVVRKTLELYLQKLLKINKYKVLAQGEVQKHNPNQKAIVESIIPQLNFLLLKKKIITKLEEKSGEGEVLNDELLKILKDRGYTINSFGEKNAVINDAPAFIRPASKKSKGWQITIRGGKEGSFIDSLRKGKGHLIVPRGRVLMIPLAKVLELVTSPELEKDTADVWVNFKEGKIELSYKDRTIEITQYALLS